jgi:hypothetical protein
MCERKLSHCGACAFLPPNNSFPLPDPGWCVRVCVCVCVLVCVSVCRFGIHTKLQDSISSFHVARLSFSTSSAGDETDTKEAR